MAQLTVSDFFTVAFWNEKTDVSQGLSYIHTNGVAIQQLI